MEHLNKIDEVADNWEEVINEAEKKYKYQKDLTSKLDTHQGPFTEMTILEIVLRKVNRYPAVTNELLAAINDLRAHPTLEKGKAVLRTLLNKSFRGFDLPMASTLLRFACPSLFQIIDQRVYRFITPNKKELSLRLTPEERSPSTSTTSSSSTKNATNTYRFQKIRPHPLRAR